jgi:hypothetical protein
MAQPDRAVRETHLEDNIRPTRSLLGELVAEYLLVFMVLVLIGTVLALEATGVLGSLVHDISFLP